MARNEAGTRRGARRGPCGGWMEAKTKTRECAGRTQLRT
jgi:hypothetical protein